MCNGNQNCTQDHDLDDDLGDIFGTPSASSPASHTMADAEVTRALGQSFTENCSSCRGRGRFISYAGRDCGLCFKCKGKGKLTFKSSPEQRAKSRASAENARLRKAAEISNAAVAWAEANPEDAAWIKAKSGSFDFATAMAGSLDQYGRLTEKQHETVTRLRIRDEERDAQRKVEAEQRAANAPVVSAGRIEQAFATAQGNGVKKPKMILNGFKFSMAPAHGVNAGALYVVRVEDDQYLGKIKEGRFMAVRECSQDEQTAVAAVVNDPHGEALAYGRRTGNCCICNRELTNHASIDLGIGPICAQKFGW